MPFNKDISPKVNITKQLEFELAYDDVTVATPRRLPHELIIFKISYLKLSLFTKDYYREIQETI